MKIKKLVLVSIFAAITAVFSLISIPIGAVPISLNFIGVYLSAIILGGKLGALSQIIYISLGVMRLPIFAGFKSGIGTVVGPTGGYLLGYIVMAFIVGTFVDKIEDMNAGKLALVSLLGWISCYTLGTLQLAFVQGLTLPQAFMTGVAPFIVIDIVKVSVAVLIADRVKVAMKKAHLTI